MFRRTIVYSLLFIALFGCAPDPDPPEIDSAEYREAVSAFYLALAAGQTDEQRFAREKMEQVAAAWPREASAWANLGVIAMRQGEADAAETYFRRAIELQPDHAPFRFLYGFLQSRLGLMSEAIEEFRRASDSDPEDLFSRYALVRELERLDGEAHSEEIYRLLESLHERIPGNRVLLFELARAAFRLGEPGSVSLWVERLSELTEGLNEEVDEQLAIVRDLLEAGEMSELSLELSFLRNSIEPEPLFQEDLGEIQLPAAELGYFVTSFTWLPQPPFRAAAPDLGMRFADPEPEDEFPAEAGLVRAVTLLGDRPPLAVHVQGSTLHIGEDVTLQFPGVPDPASRFGSNGVTEIDFNYNFMNDLAMAGDRGFRLYRQNEDETFSDVTDLLGLPRSVIDAPWGGVWAADIDQDGDLDLVLASREEGVTVLRNNGDDTFTPIRPFDGVGRVVDFIWVDLTGDGTGDALFLTERGELLLYENRRAGRFERIEPASGKRTVAMTVADLNADSRFEIAILDSAGRISQLRRIAESDYWEMEPLFETGFGDIPRPGLAALMAYDLDNNGALDILATVPDETGIWLGDSDFNYTRLDRRLPGRVRSVFDIDGSERLDLLGLTHDGKTYRLMNEGTAGYAARSIRARASGIEGDRRINSFGLGGEMEIRSGLLYQKQPIMSPIVHFGLGEYEEAEMLRIIWPNGSVQAEFSELGMGTTILNEQLLKGSCPWLFAHDGEQVRFVTDAIWRSPLGLRINAQETAGVVQTYDRVRVPGELLAEREGVYDLRITAELWETHFFDYVGLVAVDHPEGTEIFVDERFVFPAPDLATRLFRTPGPVERVLDESGRDVSATLRRNDGNFLKTFRKSSYQGVVRKHWLEVVIGPDAPADAPFSLIMHGWLRPTDSSINLAIGQGSHTPPSGLRVEVSDGSGGWRLLHRDFGVPAGKLKTILLDLEGVFENPDDRRVRLGTTSEIYWDSILWGEELPSELMTERNLEPVRQDLRFRGYSLWYRPDSVSPKLPDYEEISGTAPRWRDLTGFYTRFGDVRELLSKIDDRYVIMNAGDELLLEFEAPPPPEAGARRSFVFESDGWVKDGDYNTEASATVGPLPYHGQADYEYASERTLRDDPVFRRHSKDWVDFHTRFVTPRPFREALVFE